MAAPFFTLGSINAPTRKETTYFMPRFDTSQGRSVDHCHVPDFPCNDRETTQEERKQAREWMERNFPNNTVLRVASWKYNCHGYAYSGAHAWFNYPEMFIDDDFAEVPLETARVGDVVLYMNDDELTHSAIVHSVSGGKIKKVRGKWGAMPAVKHAPEDVMPGYGAPARLLRRLAGIS